MLPLPPTPLNHCVSIYAWLELALGVLLPLSILAALEQRSRRLFAAWQARQAARHEASTSTSQQPLQQRALHLQPWPGWQLAAIFTGSSDVGSGAPWGHQVLRPQAEEEADAGTVGWLLSWAVHLYLLSCLVWIFSNALSMWL